MITQTWPTLCSQTMITKPASMPASETERHQFCRSVNFFRKTLFLWQEALFWSSNSLITEIFLSDNFPLTFCEGIVSEGRASIFLQLGSGRCWCAGPHLGHFHTSTLPPHFHTSTKARTPNPPFSISARTSSYLPPLHSYRGKHFSCFRHSPRFCSLPEVEVSELVVCTFLRLWENR